MRCSERNIIWQLVDKFSGKTLRILWNVILEWGLEQKTLCSTAKHCATWITSGKNKNEKHYCFLFSYGFYLKYMQVQTTNPAVKIPLLFFFLIEEKILLTEKKDTINGETISPLSVDWKNKNKRVFKKVQATKSLHKSVKEMPLKVPIA